MLAYLLTIIAATAVDQSKIPTPEPTIPLRLIVVEPAPPASATDDSMKKAAEKFAVKRRVLDERREAEEKRAAEEKQAEERKRAAEEKKAADRALERLKSDYQLMKSGVGRDADLNVLLALWCESRGLFAERNKRLVIANLIDPNYVRARALLGQVRYGDLWIKPDAIADRVRSDAAGAAKLAEYRARRDKTPNTAEGHWKLGLWCEINGLDVESRAHITYVTRLDPDHESARKRLGFKRFRGGWATDEAIEAMRDDEQLDKRTTARRIAQLKAWKAWLKNPESRGKAELALAKIDDPHSVAAVLQVFGIGGAADQEYAVRILSQIRSPAATRALVFLAAFGKSETVVRHASESLLVRDPGESVPTMIALIGSNVKYRLRESEGPGSTGSLIVEGDRFNIRLIYQFEEQPAVDQKDFLRMFGYLTPLEKGGDFALATVFNQRAVTDAEIEKREHFSLPFHSVIQYVNRVVLQSEDGPFIAYCYGTYRPEPTLPRVLWNRSEAVNAATASRMQLQSDLDLLNAYNSNSARINERLAPILKSVTGKDFGADREAWAKWKRDRQGCLFERKSQFEKPTWDVIVPSAYKPAYLTKLRLYNCFAKGTLVRTRTGLTPIERLKTGDQALTRDATTGELSFQPIVQVFRKPGKPVLTLDLGRESITTTPNHWLWRVGEGWVAASELKPGDRLRTLDSVAEVVAASPELPQTVYNLDVSGNHNFLIGESGALVHDGGIVEFVRRPFDAVNLEPPRPSAVQ